jgi:hypothetical protein
MHLVQDMGSLNLTKFHKNLCIKIGANPESGNRYQFIEHWLSLMDQPSLFRSGDNTKEAGDC